MDSKGNLPTPSPQPLTLGPCSKPYENYRDLTIWELRKLKPHRQWSLELELKDFRGFGL